MTKKSAKSKESMAETFPDFIDERIEQLKTLFPEAVSEGKVDFEKLRQSLGEIVDDRPERYSFTWAGKKDAIRLLQTPSRATLVSAPEESVNFDATRNLFLEGDNLEVLKLLYKSYARRVKMIYIDPPYNTGNDFVYPDDFADPLDTYLEITGQKDNNGNHLSSNTETNGRYHSAWLNMMYPRLFVARQLLSEEGLIFVSIDDHEQANLQLLMNEIFGEENRVAIVSWEKRYTRSNNARMFTSVKDSIVVYRKNSILDYLREDRTEKSDSIYSNPDDDPRGSWTSVSYVNPATKEKRPNLVYAIENPITGKKVEHPTHAWKYEKDQYQRHVGENRLYWGKDGGFKYPRLKKFLSEVSAGMVPVDLWHHQESGTTDEGSKELEALIGKNIFDNPKPSRLIKRMAKIATNMDSNDIILDFFAGSSTTAQTVLELNREDGGNRRFIMVQLPEPTKDESPAKNAGFDTIADIGKERIRRVISRMHEDKNGELPLGERNGPEDLGFKVFKLAESNFRQWTGIEEKDIDLYIQTMEMFIDPLLPDWKPENVRYEVARQEGYSLNATIEELINIKPNTIHRIIDAEKDQFFYVSLDQEFDLQTVKALELEQGLKRDDLLIVRDVALTPSLANNILQYCRLKTI